ncbi:MAG: hypothetical protein K8I02_09075, partial [Candidatus Methylomirabilis sp.]|nr:hypothetical protein [Deltaproteobacteria bacterium]
SPLSVAVDEDSFLVFVSGTNFSTMKNQIRVFAAGAAPPEFVDLTALGDPLPPPIVVSDNLANAARIVVDDVLDRLYVINQTDKTLRVYTYSASLNPPSFSYAEIAGSPFGIPNDGNPIAAALDRPGGRLFVLTTSVTGQRIEVLNVAFFPIVSHLGTHTTGLNLATSLQFRTANATLAVCNRGTTLPGALGEIAILGTDVVGPPPYAVDARVALPQDPFGVRFDFTREKAYVLLGGTQGGVQVFDTSVTPWAKADGITQTLNGVIDLGGPNALISFDGLSLNEKGGFLFVARRSASPVDGDNLVAIDLRAVPYHKPEDGNPLNLTTTQSTLATAINNNAIASPLVDQDRDRVSDSVDNCPLTPNPKQEDNDSDGLGDA